MLLIQSTINRTGLFWLRF